MIQVREMTANDYERVSEILCACYRWLREPEQFTDEQVEWLVVNRGSVNVVRDESQSQTYLVASRDAQIVGMVAIADNQITKLYVDPDDHRQSVGRALFEAAERIVRDARHNEIILGSQVSAVPFYEAMGMIALRHKPCTAAPMIGRDVIIMKKDLTSAY